MLFIKLLMKECSAQSWVEDTEVLSVLYPPPAEKAIANQPGFRGQHAQRRRPSGLRALFKDMRGIRPDQLNVIVINREKPPATRMPVPARNKKKAKRRPTTTTAHIVEKGCAGWEVKELLSEWLIGLIMGECG